MHAVDSFQGSYIWISAKTNKKLDKFWVAIVACIVNRVKLVLIFTYLADTGCIYPFLYCVLHLQIYLIE